MDSSTSSDNINCITRAESECCSFPDFVQYDDKGNIVYYYRPQRNDMGRNIFTVQDMYGKEIGSINFDIVGCSLVTYNFYDEYKQMKILY